MKQIRQADLGAAYQGSWYTIAGCGGDLQEWVDGYEKIMTAQEIGRPKCWYQASGAAVNWYASQNGTYQIKERDLFKDDLTLLLFPLDGLGGPLPLFKLAMADRWFDDIIDNMRRG